MLSFLLGVLSVVQEASPPETVDVGGRAVPLTWPGPSAPQIDRPKVDIGGTRFEVLPDGSLGRPLRIDGSWADAKLKYAPGAERTDTYRCLVVLIERWTVLDVSSGRVIRRRGTLEPFLVEEIEQGLARFKALAEAAADNRVHLKFDVARDQDPGFTILEGPPSLGPISYGPTTPADPASLVSQIIVERVAPRFNDETFDTDSPGYRGPYSSVFVVHAGLIAATTTVWVDNTPVTVIGHSTVTQDKVALGLPSALFAFWQNHVAGLSLGREFMETGPPRQRFTARPDWTGGGAWPDLAVAAAQRRRPNGIASAIGPGPEGASVWLTGSGLAVRPEAVGAVRSVLKGWQEPTQWASTPSGPVVLAPVPAGGGSAIQALRIEPPAGRTSLEPRSVGSTVGDWEARLETDRDGQTFWRVTQTGISSRGNFLLGDVAGSGARSAKFRIRTDFEGGTVAEVLGPDRTTPLVRLAVCGSIPHIVDAPRDVVLLDARAPSDGQWHTVTVPLPDGATEVVIGPYAPGLLERPVFGPSVIDLAGFEASAEPCPQPRTFAPPPTALTDEAALAALAGGNDEERTQACLHFVLHPNPDAVPALAPLLRSANPVVALLAGWAVAKAGGNDGWTAIKSALEQGPFDHNRRFAATRLAEQPDAAMGASLGLMTAKSPSARLAAARALAAIKEESADVILIAMMANEPDPGVRMVIAQSANLENALVNRRLLFAALNDESQWVRATCLLRLIQSPDPKTRQEAFQGLRDPAVGVRLLLLDAMTKDPDEAFRPALRAAVTDRDPRVRAAALRAFAAQPGPVSKAEVANAANDLDPDVAAAYAELVKAKGLDGP
jgi:HEAT repeat protein